MAPDGLFRLLLLGILHLGIVRALDMPQPVDRFYEEVVRLLRRVRQKGGEWIKVNGKKLETKESELYENFLLNLI